MMNQSIIEFLHDLQANNNREWFEQNRDKYQKAREDFKLLVEMLIMKINEFDTSVATSTPQNSIFRIHRDMRFAKNKPPYKTNFGAYMVKDGKKSNHAGYYLHLEPGRYFLSGGIYCPPADVLRAIRTAIYNSPGEFKAIIYDKQFKALFGELYGEKLKTAPRGFPKDFEDIQLLNYKSYVNVHQISEERVMQDDFINYAIDIYRKALPFNQFLNRAIETRVE